MENRTELLPDSPLRDAVKEEKKGLTMRQMCEHIVKADILEGSPSAEQIFNYSQRGELFMVFEWYERACMLLGHGAE